MTDKEYYGKIFSDGEILTRVLLVALSDGDVYGELSDCRQLTSKATFAFKSMTIFRKSCLQITLSAQYMQKKSDGVNVAMPMIMIFPDAIIRKESRAILLMEPTFNFIDNYFDQGLDYEYVSNGTHEGYALSGATLMRLYAIEDLKIRFYVLLHQIKRTAFDAVTHFEALRFKAYETTRTHS